MKPRFINFYMNMARLCASMSRAKRLQVGCVIVKDDNVISHSWNGTPRGWDNECEITLPEEIDPVSRTITPARTITKPEVIHAESNAISKLGRGSASGFDATLFVTHAPCIECAKLIYQAGITEVFYANTYRSEAGLAFLSQCGISTHHVPEITDKLTNT